MPTTTNFGWTTPADTDLVKDGASAIRTLGNGIDTSLLDLKGGTTGQILSKASNADLDYTWINNDQGDITAVTAGTGISGGGTSGAVTITNSMATEITAAGDIIVGTGSGTFDNLPIGTTGQILTADTTVSPYKVKWASPAGGGKILQVVQTAKTDTFSSSGTTSYVDITNLSATITPAATSSKILILVSLGIVDGAADTLVTAQIVRDSTAIFIGDAASNRTRGTTLYRATSSYQPSPQAWHYLDSPSTTSATTYKIQMRNFDNGTFYVNRGDADDDSANRSRGASSIILMEVGA